MTDREDSLPHPLEQLLIRSARLDVPTSFARERVLAAGLQELSAPPAVRSRIHPGLLAGAGVLLAAAALALYLRKTPSPAPALVAEAAVAKSVSPVAPAPLPACPEVVVARGDVPLLEDWEDNDLRLIKNDGREGKWSVIDDGTQKRSPAEAPLIPRLIPGRRDSSRRALFISTGKFEKWGFQLLTDLAAGSCYDLSAYAGVEFWAKGKGRVQVGLAMIDIQESKYGGFCSKDCYNSHRTAVEFSGGWRRYSVRWEELQQGLPRGRVEFDPKRIRHLEFGIFAPDTPIEFWLDDIEFIRR
jgi:hypothetical protein